MTEKEKQIIENLIKGMSDDELNVVINCVPDKLLWTALYNRYEANRKIVDGLESLVGKA